MPADAARPDPATVLAVAPNFKRRLSGVTSTLERVVPLQARDLPVAALGPGLSAHLPRIRFRDLPVFWRRPTARTFRIWHARRNIEMLAGLVLRDVMRMPLKVVFTSASQRVHTGWSRLLISRVDAVIATSGRTAGYLKRPSTVIRHGIDPAPFDLGLDRPAARAALGLPNLSLVGCFGRIRAQKGTDVFVDAMIRLLPDRPGWGAVVLGRATAKDIAFLADLKARVAAAGLADRILFPPEVPPSETPRFYAALDLFIAPQRWEGFGVTPLEAMAAACPVVATTVGAFPELVVEGRTGRLIPPGDVAAMADAAAAFMDDGPAARAAGDAGRSHVAETFTLTGEAAAINAVYEALWSAAGSGVSR